MDLILLKIVRLSRSNKNYWKYKISLKRSDDVNVEIQLSIRVYQ